MLIYDVLFFFPPSVAKRGEDGESVPIDVKDEMRLQHLVKLAQLEEGTPAGHCNHALY